MVAPSQAQEDLAEILIPMIRNGRVGDAIRLIDLYEDPITMGGALGTVVRKLYQGSQDVTNMIAAGDLGLAYCLRKAALESDRDKTRELKKLGKMIAFNTAANCWPGWADADVVIEEAHIRAGIKLAAQCRNLMQELALAPREQGGAHWLVGALELAGGGFEVARASFEQAEHWFLTDDHLLPYALMARGYMALARKADPRSRQEGADALIEVLDRLRAEGSKDAVFFADQLGTAERVLIGE
jgi:hypothetical protein